jgi:hypothetical protein
LPASGVADAARFGLNQPKVSAVRNTRLEGFSMERLMTLPNALDRDVEIVIRAKPRSRGGADVKTIEVKASHLSLISHPDEITLLILEAAGQDA